MDAMVEDGRSEERLAGLQDNREVEKLSNAGGSMDTSNEQDVARDDTEGAGVGPSEQEMRRLRRAGGEEAESGGDGDGEGEVGSMAEELRKTSLRD
jgi:hypothetical protein